MRKVYLSIFLMLVTSFLFGCTNDSEAKIVKRINSSLDDIDSYYLDGDLTIHNNDDKYDYKVEVYYKAKDYYRVNLVNKANDHEQIILKNDDGVYVITHKSTQL